MLADVRLNRQAKIWITISCFLIFITLFALDQKYIVHQQHIELKEQDIDHEGESRQHRLPNVLIIGAMKSGTSTLSRYLDCHPDIVVGPDEVNYFDKDDNYRKGKEWYRNQMPLSLPGQIVIEKSPAYLQYTDVVPQRVHAFNSSIKLLVILVDPLMRTVSHFAHRIAVSQHDIKPLSHYVLNDTTATVNSNSLPVKTSMYYNRIKDWFKWFPRNQFHFVDGEKFIENPMDELFKVENFLGVRHFFHKEHFVYNATKGFYCFNGTDTFHCMGDNKGRKHPAVERDVLVKLQKFFTPLNKKLYNLINQTFDWPETLPQSNKTKLVV